MAFDIKEHLIEDRVAVLSPPTGLRLTRNHKVRDAIELMQANRSGCVMICDGEKLMGIFTERDYLRRVLGDGLNLDTPLADSYTDQPTTINEKDSVADLIRMIHSGGFRHVPVVNDLGDLVGVVAVRNVLHHLAEHYPNAVYNVSPVSNPRTQQREGA